MQVTKNAEKLYRIIGFYLDFSTSASLVNKCVKCDGKVNFYSTKIQGHRFSIKVSCERCNQISNIPCSSRLSSSIYVVNDRFVYVPIGLKITIPYIFMCITLMDCESSVNDNMKT